MKTRLLWALLSWLSLLSFGARAQNNVLLAQENFENGTAGTNPTYGYTANNFQVTSNTQYFQRQQLNTGAPAYPGTSQQVTNIEGSYAWTAEGVRGTGTRTVRSAGYVQLNSVTTSGYKNFRMTVAFADPAGTSCNSCSRNAVLASDRVRLQYSFDGGPFVTAGLLVNNSDGYWQQDTSTPLDSVADGTVINQDFKDITANISGTGGALRVRVVCDFRSPILVFDNIRVYGDVNVVPTPTLNNLETTAGSYTENGSPVQLTNSLTVGYSDGSTPTLTGGTVSISANFVSGDRLNFTNQPGITGSYNTATGLLTLTGTATQAAYQAALRTITYSSTNVTTLNTGTRQITFQVRNGATVSNTPVRTLNITAVLNAPAALNYTEDFTADADGTRYFGNVWADVNIRTGSFRATASPAVYNGTQIGDATFTGWSGGYWFGESPSTTLNPTNPYSVVQLAPVNATGRSNIRFTVAIGAAGPWLGYFNANNVGDQFELLYSTDGGTTLTKFGAFYGVDATTPARQDADLDPLTPATGTLLGTALQDFTFDIPAAAAVSNLTFVLRQRSRAGGIELAYDNIRITAAVSPTVATGTAGSLTTTTAAISNNSLTADGGANISDYGVVYVAGTGTPTTANSKVQVGTTQPASFPTSFTANLAGLTAGTQYTARAYATNSVGTSYGASVTFTTLSTPTVTTATPSTLTTTSVVLGGSVTADGGAAVTERGVVYSTTNQTPTTGDTKDANGTGTGSYSKTIAGLTPGTTYYVRAYAINSVGTSYGSAVSFVTTPNAPVVTTPPDGTFVTTTTTTYQGTAQANATITVYVDGTALASTTTANSAGNWTLTQPTALAQGNHTVRATAAINGSAASASSATSTFTVDSVRPSVAITSSTATNGSSTSTMPFAYTVTFSEPVTSFVAGDVSVTNGTLSGFMGSGASYTFTVTPATAGTATTVNVPINVAQDQAGNGNTAAPSAYSITYTQPVTAAPVVTAPANGSLVNTTTPTYSGTAVAGSTVTVSVDGTPIGTTLATAGGTFSLAQPTALAQGAHTVSATAQASGSAASASSATSTFTVDSVRPSVAITSSTATNGSSTSTSPIAYTVTFSESVTGFVAGDVSVTNGTLSGFTGSGTSYTFTVTPAANGAVTVNVASNVAQDAALNGNTAAPSAYSITYTQSMTAAQNVTVQLNANGTATLNASSVNNGSTGAGTLTYTIQKVVYGQVAEGQVLPLSTPTGENFSAIRFASYGTPTGSNGNYTLGGCNASTSTTAVGGILLGNPSGSITANNTTFGDPCGGTPKSLAVVAAYSATAASLPYTCANVAGPNYVLLTVTDGNGNTSTMTAQVTVLAPPTASFTLSSTSGNVGATVTASGSNLSGATALTVNGAAAPISNLTASGFTFVVPAGATLGAGSVVLTTPCGQSPSAAFTVTQLVTAAPVVTTPSNGSLVSTATPNYAGTAPAGSVVTVYVDGTALASTVTATSAGNWGISQPTALAQGAHTVYATAQTSGSAVSATSNTNTFTVDTVRPSVAISSSAGASGSSTGTSPIPFTVTFSENVTGFVAGNVSVTNGTIAAGSFTGASGTTTYTFAVTPTTAGTATTVSVPAAVAQDAATNGNTAAPSAYSITYTPPVVAAPTLTAVAPTPGGLGQAITLTGTDLGSPTALTINGADALAGLLSNDGRTLVVRVPVTAASAGTVRITTAAGTAALPFSVMAPPGNALAFDGSDDYVRPAGTLPASGEFTLEAWVNPTALSNQFSALVLADDFPAGAMHCQFYGTQLGFTINGNTPTNVVSTVALPLNRWTHVAVVYSASAQTVQFYLNGVLVTTGTYTTARALSATSYSVGAWRTGGTVQRALRGRLDELRLYGAALTQAQVQADMLSTTPAVPASLALSLNFDQGTPATASTGANIGLTTLYDLSPNATPATLTNFALASGNLSSNYVASYALVVPTATAATSQTSTSFIATWTAPAYGTVTSYLLDVSTTPDFASPVAGSPFSAAASATSYGVTGLTQNTTYYYRVRALNSALAQPDQGAFSNTRAVATPLPVELVSFTAVAQGRTAVRLAWATASELNSARFEVERSLDGASFQQISAVAAAGTTTTVHTYGLLDATLPTGTTLLYYRLRQVDVDGTAHYSVVRPVALAGAPAELSLYPNPVHGGTATLLGAAPGTRAIVLDAVGRTVFSAPVDATGTATLELPLGLATGVYIVRAGAQALRLTVE